MIVQFVNLVFLDDENLGRLMLLVLVLFGLFFMAMLSIVSLSVMRMERLLLTVGMYVTRFSMAMTMDLRVVGVSMMSRRPHVRMGSMHPRFTQVALKWVGPRLVAIGTVLTRLLIIICA